MSIARSIGVRVTCAALCLVAGLAAAADINADHTTYQAALKTLQPGDTLHLAADTYVGLALSNLNGTASKWITITGPASDPASAVIQAPSSGCCDVIEITNSSFLAIENLKVDGNHVPSAFGVSAKGGLSNRVHDIRVEGCTFVNIDNDGVPADLGQQDDAISTKTPTWGWIIRNNQILGAGTGLYLGNSTGDDPFIGGVIEGNLVDAPTGYCMEIKWQKPRPAVAGMPTGPTSTIVRNNVFIKTDHAATTSGTRTNVLVGGFPSTGPGSEDRYEIYSNFFFHNSDDALLQASGRVTIHDNVFVDAPNRSAIVLRDQDLPLQLAYVYDNTIYDTANGIVFGNSAPGGDAVFGNLVFAATPISGPITHLRDNLTDTVANAGNYVNKPSTTLGQMDFYPKPGQCRSTAIDSSLFVNDVAFNVDFNCSARGFEYRGAYAGQGTNPGWPLAKGIKPNQSCGGGGGDGGSQADGGVGADAGDAGSATPGPSSDAGTGHSAVGSSCACGSAAGPGLAPMFSGLLLGLLLVRVRRRDNDQP